MAHHEAERTAMHGVLDLLVDNGLEGMADAMATMLNEATKIERSISEAEVHWRALGISVGTDNENLRIASFSDVARRTQSESPIFCS